MTSTYEFKAPQFVDFNACSDDSDEADKFFDVEQETPPREENKENKPYDLPNSHLKVKIIQEVVRTPITDPEKPNSNQKRRDMLKAVRRFSDVRKEKSPIKIESDGNVEESLTQEISNISLRTKKRTHFDGIAITVKEEKQHCMTTRNDEKAKTPKLELRTRSVNKEEEIIRNLKRKSNFEKGEVGKKYMALAESILHYQKDTPPRFHSHSRRKSSIHNNMLKKRQSYNPRRTIALTPKLLTSHRSRPIELPTKEEREKMEVEEMMNYQIKAHPLNEKIFQPPNPPRRSERPNTVIEPFNITHVFKKPPPKLEEEPYKFTANPIPKVIFKKPVGVGPKKDIPITVPESPAITKPKRSYKPVRVAAVSNDNKESSADLTSLGVPVSKSIVLKTTEVKPFSFETRDKEMMEKKEKKLKEILEAEKRAREFKANPVPAFGVPKETNRSMMHSHLDCSKTSISSRTDDEPRQPFKARSPRVLRKDPFKPVKEHVHSEPLDVKLWTERRAQERQDFQTKQAEKEDRLAWLREERERDKKQKEEEELARLRKETVHKAQPMPKFKPKSIKDKVSSTLPLTTPKSPNFTKRVRTTTLCSSSLANE